ncbi:putative pentatricopeptide repeat-containing protein at5g08310 mitochondrial [Phtheirospermum japonicum]|uniref:Putative pentatricopeptide repeat-containing protein at5g08310 mitochondrial n=1 Tax=Phtheirospermum japonicum TaxID=374723 RepID=A0A830D434_9LAMI|nr:putative pentatricopeptide repeat-containing protein at5g08310 mitochondrial [Phtheirospermum japonicum]
MNITSKIRLIQTKTIFSHARTSTVEASLISAFTKKPFCLESPELQELSSKLTPEVVETVLKSFRNWRSAQMFFNWASKQEGYTHSCYTYNAMAAILSSARQNASLKDLAVSLSKSWCFWTPGALGYFLRCLGSQGLVEEANSLFDLVKVSGLCVINSYSYNCLLEVIAKGCDVGLLEYRLNEMRNLGWDIDKHALTPVLQCYCNARRFDKALMVFNDLNEKGWVDQHILAILVLSYSKRGEVDMAFELIERAEKNLNISLNEKTVYVLIHGFVREYRVDRALDLYDKMKKLGYLPDISVYDVLISGLCKNKEIGKALMLYMHMLESGISPDVRIITQLLLSIPEEKDMIQLLRDSWMNLDVGKRMLLYASVLTGLVNGGNVDKAYHLLKASVGSGIADKLDMALDLFHDIDKSGCKRSVLLFNNLIHCLSNANRLNECFDLLNEMKRSEFEPTHFTFNCILGCQCRRVDVEGALGLLREMRVCGHNPWIKHYTLLTKKLCEAGKAVEACNFLANMTKEGFLPDLIAYATTIDGFFNINELDHGLRLFREICERGYCPDVVTYNILIKGLCMAKRTTEAEDILNEMLGKGLVPSVVTYNLLICGWCKDGDTDQAVQWFSKMIKEEQEPNVITYSTLVDGLCNAGKPDEALNLWREMEHKGCDPNRIAYMALIHGLCKCWKPDVALNYLQKMEEKGLLPDTYIYHSLIDAFSSSSNTAMAHEILEKMAKRCTASLNR